MPVTKQQQLEWLAKTHEYWPLVVDYTCMSHVAIGFAAFTPAAHRITRIEWQQERDKMRKTQDVTINNQTSATIAATKTGDNEMTITAQDNSWHERGELPPVGCECEMINDRGEWVKCDVIAHKDSFCVAWVRSRMSPFYTNDWNEFRPLRTEREKAIDAACDAIGGVGEDGLLIIERLYDAGLLK